MIAGQFSQGTDRLKLLSSQQLAEVDAYLHGLLERVLAVDALGTFREALRRYVIRGGKRIRPQLTAWTYLHATAADPAAPLPQPILEMACAWELFHAFLLVHDDIIDGADHRRDQPSLHRHLQSLDSDSPRFGMNLGIVAGDLLFGATMQIWADLDVPGETYKRLLKMFARVACITGFGQAIDIVQSHVPLALVREETLLREYHWKTAAYTFEGPILAAAMFAGVGPAAEGALSRFSLALGQAYQLQNDLIDLSREAAEGCDLVEAKRTVTLMRARAALHDGARQRFDDQLDAIAVANGPTASIDQRCGVMALAESFRQELLATGAVRQTSELIDTFLTDARAAAADPSLPGSLSCALGGLLDALAAQYFVAARFDL